MWYSSDAAETYCDSCVGSGRWALGGDVNTCCGDDANEFVIDCDDNERMAFCNLISAAARRACCNENSDCVYNDICYNDGDVLSGRRCEFNKWNDSVDPTVAVTGAPASWVNTDQIASVSCSDVGSGCDSSTYMLRSYSADPGSCPTDHTVYDIPMFPINTHTVSSHVWLCGAAKDNRGNPGFSPGPEHPKEFMVDKIKPTTTIDSPDASSWQSASFNVGLTDSDTGGSGVDTGTCEYRVYDTGFGGFTRGWTSRSCSALRQITIGPAADCRTDGLDTCRVYARTSDIAGNQGDTNIRYFSVDTTGPSCTFNSITEGSNPGYQFVSGSTLFYNSNVVGGSFTVRVDAGDGGDGSGIDHVNFPATVSDSGDDDASPYEWLYTWDTSDNSDYLNAVVTCYDEVGWTDTTTFSVDLDVSAPSGGSIDYPNGLWNMSAVSVDFGTVSDSESGINASTAALYRRQRPLSGGSCVGAGWTAWGAPIASGPAASPPNYIDSTILNGMCYQYRYDIYDNVLNRGSYEQPAYELKVDLNPPAGPDTFDDTNTPNGDYDDDGTLVFTYTPPNDPESGLDDCYMQIDDASDFATPVFEGWIGTSGSHTWNGGTNGNTYYARVRCRDNAGNEGGYGTPSDGIVVDTADPVITLVHDIRSPDDTDDIDTLADMNISYVYWEASDGESMIETERVVLIEFDIDTMIVTTIGGPYDLTPSSPTTSNIVMFSFPAGNMTKQLEEGKDYYFNVTVTDSVGHVTYARSDGFKVSACEGQPCGKYCNIGGTDGACNGAGQCYLGGGCDLDCAPVPPPGGSDRICFGNDNSKLPDCSTFAGLCGRTGTTKCGDDELCQDSINNFACLSVAGSGSASQVTGGWGIYTPPATGQYYGPNNPFSIQITGISLSVANFQPLLECVLETPGIDYVFNRWGSSNADLQLGPGDFPVGSDGEWNLTSCSLKTDFDNNMGWELSSDSTSHTIMVDTTPPSAWITAPQDGASVGKKFNATWDGADNYAGIKCYDFQWGEKTEIEQFGLLEWEKVDHQVLCTSQVLTEVETALAGSPELCFRVRAYDNADNVNDWSCANGDPTDTSGCNCTTLSTSAPPSVTISVYPLHTNEEPSRFTVNWSSGTKCFEVWYNVTDNTGATIQPWTQLNGGLNDMTDVPVYNGTYFTVDCTSNKEGVLFMPIAVIGVDPDNRAYGFRVRAVADGEGYTAISDWAYSSDVVVIDRSSPDVYCEAWEGSNFKPNGDFVYRGESVTFNVTGDPDGDDFSGVNETWIMYQIISGSSGEIITPWTEMTRCLDASYCEAVGMSWSDDYNISYQGFAIDRAGNVGWDSIKTLMVSSRVALVTTIMELYLRLGSYEYVRMEIANRQNENEEISLSIQDDYLYAKFLDIPDGATSPDKRTVNITLLPMETKPVMIMVYTADVGSWNMTVYANSTVVGHEDIDDYKRIRITVVFPDEFSGLSFTALVLLFALAGLAYFKFGLAKR
jgi:hypothetical protein